MDIKKQISQIVAYHINTTYADGQYRSQILSAIRALVNADLVDDCTNTAFDSCDFQEQLAKINEKGTRRKKEGVFYTDHDVTDFVVANSFACYLDGKRKSISNRANAVLSMSKCSKANAEKLLCASVFDPTCGTGEFLLSSLEIKIELNKKFKLLSPVELIRSFGGNDIEQLSIDITKIRLFFKLIDSFTEEIDVVAIAESLNRNFFNKDAVVYDGRTFGQQDIIVGNPPYVEYREFAGTPQNDFGNVYADVLKNSIDILNQSGVMAFVVPLSYVSTIRMGKIRDYVGSKANKQIVMTFADRPDCLFSSVHQKLTILIAQRNADESGIFSSSYNYWYQHERESLFNSISIVPTDVTNQAYWPKIGNKVEMAIYSHFKKLQGLDILTLVSKENFESLYINQRGCFWMKAFPRDMHSNSYARYDIPSRLYPFCYCLVNSSLFFLLWIIISDGWHLTNKELSFIKLPKSIGEPNIWESLMHRLDDELERTKVYVGTKQVDYEYKHKACKSIIDEIDDQLAIVYKLSSTQCEYIKNFALKYRTSDGTKN